MHIFRSYLLSVGGFSPRVFSQIKNRWFVQGKQMIRLISIRLNQNKLCLAEEERNFLFTECQTEWTDHANWYS